MDTTKKEKEREECGVRMIGRCCQLLRAFGAKGSEMWQLADWLQELSGEQDAWLAIAEARSRLRQGIVEACGPWPRAAELLADEELLEGMRRRLKPRVATDKTECLISDCRDNVGGRCSALECHRQPVGEAEPRAGEPEQVPVPPSRGEECLPALMMDERVQLFQELAEACGELDGLHAECKRLRMQQHQDGSRAVTVGMATVSRLQAGQSVEAGGVLLVPASDLLPNWR